MPFHSWSWCWCHCCCCCEFQLKAGTQTTNGCIRLFAQSPLCASVSGRAKRIEKRTGSPWSRGWQGGVEGDRARRGEISLHPGECKWRLRSWDLLRRKEKNICHVRVCLLSSVALKKQRRVEEGRIKWRHLASIGQHRERSLGGAVAGGMGAGSPRRPSQSPHAKRDNKRGSRLPCLAGLNCSVTLLKYSLSVDWWVMGGGRWEEGGGRSLGVAHFGPQAARLPACLPCQLPLASTFSSFLPWPVPSLIYIVRQTLTENLHQQAAVSPLRQKWPQGETERQTDWAADGVHWYWCGQQT